jgi:hypothetical protein
MTSMRKEVTHEGGDIRAMLRARDRFCEVLLEGSGSKSIYSIPGGLQGRVSVPRTTALSQAGLAGLGADAHTEAARTVR